jgi:DNA-binding response OmpR family regulator
LSGDFAGPPTAQNSDMTLYPQFRAAKRVLIAEDDERMARCLSDALNREGFQTHRVRDGIAAINFILSEKPDAVLLDRQLPRLSGDEVCQMVRKTAAVRHIPIVFISGLVSVSDRLEAFNLGADDYVIKPFATDELLARVEAVLLRACRLL